MLDGRPAERQVEHQWCHPMTLCVPDARDAGCSHNTLVVTAFNFPKDKQRVAAPCTWRRVRTVSSLPDALPLTSTPKPLYADRRRISKLHRADSLTALGHRASKYRAARRIGCPSTTPRSSRESDSLSARTLHGSSFRVLDWATETGPTGLVRKARRRLTADSPVYPRPLVYSRFVVLRGLPSSLNEHVMSPSLVRDGKVPEALNGEWATAVIGQVAHSLARPSVRQTTR